MYGVLDNIEMGLNRKWYVFVWSELHWLRIWIESYVCFSSNDFFLCVQQYSKSDLQYMDKTSWKTCYRVLIIDHWSTIVLQSAVS